MSFDLVHHPVERAHQVGQLARPDLGERLRGARPADAVGGGGELGQRLGPAPHQYQRGEQCEHRARKEDQEYGQRRMDVDPLAGKAEPQAMAPGVEVDPVDVRAVLAFHPDLRGMPGMLRKRLVEQQRIGKIGGFPG
ncbi:MAG: hypothetical protein ABS89_07335 [Thiobacillus sp. SCN 63-1177]|nr:MAG: hypothetical protein ABS89_07335 [Thiobacillus sp. SCN 63-1177]